MRSLALLGSTGSIGTQTLELVRAEQARAGGPRFEVRGLAAGSSWQKVLEQAREFRPRMIALADPEAAERLRQALVVDPDFVNGSAPVVFDGPDAVARLVTELDYDLCVHGIVGARGVEPSRLVLERGKDLALANKESLVVAGAHLMELARRSGSTLLPVDSEHSAIFQCLTGEDARRVRCIWLTASGGALRDLPLSELDDVTPEQALAHPNWDMGPRITVGSATLMNKALEVIEAHHLFGLEAERIRVVVHRQSLVHSMVEFEDGSVLAQMGPPDMRLPIHYALHWPERAAAPFAGFDLELFRSLTFEPADPVRFPALELGFECVRLGSDAGAVLNAADEVAVAAFLAGEIGFQDIARVNRRVLERRPGLDHSVEALLRADARARELARSEVDDLRGPRPPHLRPDVARPGARPAGPH